MRTPEAVVTRFFELAGGEDTESIVELLDPDVVWRGTQGGLDADLVVRGSAAFLAYMQEIQQTWEQFEVEVERLMESDDKVIVFLRETAQGRDALELQNETAVVLKVSRGRIAQARGYLDREEALRAAGLPT